MRGRRWQRLRMAVMRNFGYMCGKCGGAIAEEVHHRDGDVTNNAFPNLLPVCKPCHLQLEAEKRQSVRQR
jgi:hypothetical protein